MSKPHSQSQNSLRFSVSDALLWLLVLLVIGWLAYEYGYRQPNSQKQIVKLYFKDANELARGSAVRMMGTEVGYVHSIVLREGSDTVEVLVKTYPDALRIPSGSKFTVEFTGLVGSKSIEIIPPAVPRPTIEGRAQYFTEEPIRLRDTLQYQIDIAQALQRGSENFTDFFGKKKPLEELQHNISASQQGLIAANKKMIEIHSKVDNAHRDIAPGIQKTKDILANFASATGEARQLTEPDYLGPYLSGMMHTVNMIFLEGQATIISMQVEQKVDRLNDQHLIGIADKMYDWRQKSKAVTIGRTVSNVNAGITQFHEFLSNTHRYFEANRLIAMKRFRSGLQQFNQKLLDLYHKLDKSQEKADQASSKGNS